MLASFLMPISLLKYLWLKTLFTSETNHPLINILENIMIHYDLLITNYIKPGNLLEICLASDLWPLVSCGSIPSLNPYVSPKFHCVCKYV